MNCACDSSVQVIFTFLTGRLPKQLRHFLHIGVRHLYVRRHCLRCSLSPVPRHRRTDCNSLGTKEAQDCDEQLQGQCTCRRAPLLSEKPRVKSCGMQHANLRAVHLAAQTHLQSMVPQMLPQAWPCCPAI